jgi:nucleotide-binding universal stress UspA family protein
LVAIDGSEHATRAAAHALRLVQDGLPAEVHFLNVQPPVGGGVSAIVSRSQVEAHLRDEGMKVLAEPKALADRAGIAVELHVCVGAPPSQVIADFARKLGCDHLILGSHGRGRALDLLLGSAVSDVLRRVDIPVTIIK